MIISGFTLWLDHAGTPLKFKPGEWLTMLAGSTLILYSFISDYSALLFRDGRLNRSAPLSANSEFQQRLITYTPDHYQWIWFGLGITFILLATCLSVLRNLDHRLISAGNSSKSGL